MNISPLNATLALPATPTGPELLQEFDAVRDLVGSAARTTSLYSSRAKWMAAEAAERGAALIQHLDGEPLELVSAALEDVARGLDTWGVTARAPFMRAYGKLNLAEVPLLRQYR